MQARALIATVLLGIALATAACSAQRPIFVDEQGSYDSGTAIELLEASDAGGLPKTPVEDAERLRTEALASLRGQGTTGSAAAKTITLAFSDSPRGVPYYVEAATFEGRESWVLLEATGRPGEMLSQRRLWVISPTGQIRFFAAR